MKEFIKVNKVFIKSNNTTNKIFNRYLYSLIPFFLLLIIYNLISNSTFIVINLLKSTLVSIIISMLTQYIFNLIKKEKDIIKIFKEDNVLTISLVLGLFSVNSNILIIIVSNIVSVIIKNLFKNITISSSLYGILIILLSKYLFNDINTPLYNLSQLSYISNYNNLVTPYGTLIDYIFGLNFYYLSPIISIIVFIYLFNKKSIKYNIYFSYIFTFSFIMLFVGIFNDMNIWYLLFQLTTGNILFLSVFCLVDYPATPITSEGQIIYGIILGIITSILRFIIPELSVVIALVLGPITLTKIINKISPQLKYNKKLYYMVMCLFIVLVIMTTIILNVIF